jgi:hypothetical protein
VTNSDITHTSTTDSQKLPGTSDLLPLLNTAGCFVGCLPNATEHRARSAVDFNAVAIYLTTAEELPALREDKRSALLLPFRSTPSL